jgi:nitroimidazol reductase NimA-like FMN-containing flavoprotein (pyridoxamine 5'-phosphate oxidase superfamily)
MWCLYVLVMRRGALYFHSAREGRKLEILKKNPKVSFEMDID